MRNKRDLGDSAVWAASSSKVGCGVSNLRDGSDETFWQSDGAMPHTITAHFLRRATLLEVQLRLDFRADESYTPARIAIRAGTTLHDLREVLTAELENPSGWISFSLLDAKRYCNVK